MKTEHVHGALVCRAGKGEWYNQPHDKRWDMGEDSADLPPARWHVELQETIDAKGSAPSVVVVDVTEMDWLVGKA